jgi:hypothetical protein
VNVRTLHIWVAKSRDSGGKLHHNNQPRFGRPFAATDDLTRQAIKNLHKKNARISQTYTAEN